MIAVIDGRTHELFSPCYLKRVSKQGEPLSLRWFIIGLHKQPYWCDEFIAEGESMRAVFSLPNGQTQSVKVSNFKVYPGDHELWASRAQPRA